MRTTGAKSTIFPKMCKLFLISLKGSNPYAHDHL